VNSAGSPGAAVLAFALRDVLRIPVAVNRSTHRASPAAALVSEDFGIDFSREVFGDCSKCTGSANPLENSAERTRLEIVRLRPPFGRKILAATHCPGSSTAGPTNGGSTEVTDVKHMKWWGWGGMASHSITTTSPVLLLGLTFASGPEPGAATVAPPTFDDLDVPASRARVPTLAELTAIAGETT
jgi:hypothetical protein